jgi:hypothetical protein
VDGVPTFQIARLNLPTFGWATSRDSSGSTAAGAPTPSKSTPLSQAGTASPSRMLGQ